MYKVQVTGVRKRKKTSGLRIKLSTKIFVFDTFPRGKWCGIFPFILYSSHHRKQITRDARNRWKHRSKLKWTVGIIQPAHEEVSIPLQALPFLKNFWMSLIFGKNSINWKNWAYYVLSNFWYCRSRLPNTKWCVRSLVNTCKDFFVLYFHHQWRDSTTKSTLMTEGGH